MKKRFVIVIIVLLLMGIGSFIVFNIAKDDKKDKENKKDGTMTISEDIIIDLLDNMEKDKYKVEDLTFRDVKVFVNDGKDSFQATVLCEDARDKLELEIILYNKENKKVDTLKFELLDIEENDERNLFCLVDSDLYDAYYFKVKVR